MGETELESTVERKHGRRVTEVKEPRNSMGETGGIAGSMGGTRNYQNAAGIGDDGRYGCGKYKTHS